MKIAKRLYSGILLLLIALLFTACSASNTPNNEDNFSSSTTGEIISAESTGESTDKNTEETTEHLHTHSFTAATCTEPRTCSCGITEGEANGHSWHDATCIDPKTCSVCGATSGLTAGHNFSDGKCITCGKADPDYNQETLVWIPTNGGTKYHTKAECSNIKNPKQVTQSEAESQGFTPCKRCH